MNKQSRQRYLPGLIGGMGPIATVYFLQRLIDKTPASEEQDHLHILIEHNPQVPNRHFSIEGSGPDAQPEILRMATWLQQGGADFVVMSCNTAHVYADAIQEKLQIPFISIIETSCRALIKDKEVKDEEVKHNDQGAKVGIMAAEGCLQTGLYQQEIERLGMQPVLWDAAQLEEFMRILYAIKANKDPRNYQESMQDLARSLVSQGCTTLIAGCTEIPLVADYADLPVPVVCSTESLVERVIKIASGEEPLPLRE